MTSINVSSFTEKHGEHVKTETHELYNVEGFRVYARLDVYEYCSTFLVNAFNGEGPAVATLLSGFSCNTDHIKYCRTEMHKYLKSKYFKLTCKNLAAEMEVA